METNGNGIRFPFPFADRTNGIPQVMLPPTVWSLIENQHYDSWHSLKAVVKEQIGLTKSQLLDAIFGMRQSDSESAAHFIISVEDKRALYNIVEDQCWCHFTPLLDVNEYTRLDKVMELTATMGGPT